MKRFFLFSLCLVFVFLLSSCKSSSTTPITSTTTSEVHGPVEIRETGADFNTIGEAITAAEAGDIYAGTYNENIGVNKKLYLVGEDKASVTINGGGAEKAVEFTAGANGSELSGVTIKNSGSNYGVYSENVSLEIKDCVIDDCYAGIFMANLTGSSTVDEVLIDGVTNAFGAKGSVTITNTTIRNSLNGISCEQGSQKIANCVITNNRNHGVFCCNSGTPDLGGGALGSPGYNKIQGNKWDVYNLQPASLKAEHNYWDHNTTYGIDHYDIYDDEEGGGGAVDFTPFETSVLFSSLRMKPGLSSASSLFRDFFRSLFRADGATSAVYLPRSFETRMMVARYQLLLGRGLTTERYYPPLRLRMKR